MEENMLDISEEMLENMSAEELAEIKVELEDLLNKANEIIETCDEALNY